MARRDDARRVMRLGATTLVILALVMAAAFNLQKFPGFRGTTYHAEFNDAAGLRVGSVVQVAGMRVGRVDDIAIDGDKVLVTFDVRRAQLGPDTSASVEVYNLLGEKFLDLQPAGEGSMKSGSTTPQSRTDTSYDIVDTLGELTTTTEQIDTTRLSTALSTLGDTLDAAAPEVQQSFTGISRLSRTIASRDDGIKRLLTRADRVTRLLADRRGDLVVLMKQADRIFAEVQARKAAIHTLLVNTRELAVSLRGIAKDNQRQIGPALAKLTTVTRFLDDRRASLSTILRDLKPYTNILGNIIGTGPWFDAYVVNLLALPTGEFQPGGRS